MQKVWYWRLTGVPITLLELYKYNLKIDVLQTWIFSGTVHAKNFNFYAREFFFKSTGGEVKREGSAVIFLPQNFYLGMNFPKSMQSLSLHWVNTLNPIGGV